MIHSGPSLLGPVQVLVSTMNGTATSNADFIPLTDLVLTFNESSGIQVVRVAIVNDDVTEDSESL